MSFDDRTGSLSATLPTFILAALLAAGTVPAAAQTVLGRLVDQETGDPLDAAFVVLLDSAGVERGATLTTGEGRYMLRAPGPGRYTIRAELIGYASHSSPTLSLAPDENRVYDMAVSFQAIELTAIDVRGEQRCTVRPGSGLRTAEVWEEARKALRLTAWTAEQGTVRFRAVGFERALDPQTLRVLSEQRAGRSGYTAGSPYESRPAEDLAERGYVRAEEDGTWIYFAPDAQVLLSDSFLDAHCFELTEHESRPELIGLAFRPVRRREQADIQGVLWLHRQSSELRYLEFTYATLPYPVESAVMGGRVDFDRLRSGPWIVRSWHIRAPEVALERQDFRALRRNEQRYRVTLVQEVGAEVQDVVGRDGSSLLSEDEGGGSVTGVVYDAGGHTTVAGARVSVAGTSRTSQSREDGQFELHGLPEGRYELRVTPESWDLPWVPPVTTEVTIQTGDTGHVRINQPSPVEVAHSLCGNALADTLPGVILGQVTEDADGRPISGREVVAIWGDFTVVDDARGFGMQGSWRGTTVVTDDNGWFLACGLPGETPIRVRPVPSYDPTPDVTARRLWQADARMPPDARETRVGYGDPIGRVDLKVRQADAQEVTARVVDEETRSALVGPDVTLMAADSSEIAHTTSGPDGFFTLSLEPGRYILRIEHRGYETLTQSFALEGGQSTLPAFVLRTTAIPLDPLVVEVNRGNVTMGGFERSARPVHVLAGERMAILESTGVSFTSAVRELGAGLRMRDVRVGGRSYSCIESNRTLPSFGGGGSCRMVAIIIDGVDTGMDGEEALRFVRALQVRDFESLEFLSQLDAGVRYGLRAGDRGALLLWTRGIGPHQSKARGGG